MFKKETKKLQREKQYEGNPGIKRKEVEESKIGVKEEREGRRK